MRRTATSKKMANFLTYMWNCEQKATIGTIKFTIIIPPWHNGIVSIKMNGPIIKEQLAHFLTDDKTTKGRNPYIHMINRIHKIKCRASVPILVSNYTNKHITFTKGEYVGHFEPTTIEDATIDEKEASSTYSDETDALSTNSIALKKMLVEQVHPDTFEPSHHMIPSHIQHKLDTLLLEYKSQFAQDETSIGTTPLMSMTINRGDSPPISQKPYLITMKNHQWVKEDHHCCFSHANCQIYSGAI